MSTTAVPSGQSPKSKLKLTPPKGAEFGTTEVFYLNAQSESRERSVALAAAVSRHLQVHFQKLRNDRAQSMIDELTRTGGQLAARVQRLRGRAHPSRGPAACGSPAGRRSRRRWTRWRPRACWARAPRWRGSGGSPGGAPR